MATIETIRRIRVQQISEGGDAVRRDLQGLVDAQQKVAAASDAAAVVTENASRRQLSAASAYQKVAGQLDQNVRASAQYERALKSIDRAFEQGVVDGNEHARMLGLLENRYGAVSRAAEQAAAAQRRAWAELSSVGSRALENAEASRKLGSIGTPAAANQNDRLRADQVQNLLYQGGDVLSQLGSGSPLGMIAFQQGPQIAQAFAGPGGASIKGAFSQAGEAAAGLASRIGIVGGAIGALGTVTVTAAAAAVSYDDAQRELERSLIGVRRASGATASQINALAPAAAAAANVSVRTAREMAGQFAATGRIGAEMYAGLIGTVKDYAATTGQEMPEATKALADAFADPSRGAGTLDKQLGFLNDTTRETIQRLEAQGNRLGAQQALFTAYRASLTSATELTSGWARITAAAGTTISNAWDAVGKAVARGATGGDLETRIADIQRVLREGPQQQTGILGFLGVGAQRGAVQGELDKLLEQQRRQQQASVQAQQNRLSSEVGEIVRGLNPAAEQLKKIEDQAAKIRSGLSRLPLDEQGDAKRTMDGLSASARLLREDLQAGGTQFANAIRDAQFGLRTVGFTQQGRGAAEINQRADNEIRAAQTNASDPLLRDYQINAIRERQRIELETVRQQSALTENAAGSAFSRMSANLQQQVQAASEQFGRIPAGIIAGIAQVESNGNPNVGFSKARGEDGRTSSAYGLGQINAPTAAAAIKGGYLPKDFDRMNPATMAEGIAGVLEMKRVQNGGTIEGAIKGYFGSTSDTANNAYLAKVLRASGQMGDASIGAQARNQDEATRGLRDQNEALERASQFYGKNGLALDAAGQAAQRYNQLLDAGVPASTALAASIQELATKSATAAQQVKLVQFGRDVAFDREQLGRTGSDQSAYARARSMIGDTASPAAQLVIDQQRLNDNLRETKALATDAFGGFAQDLAHGTSAANALTNALSRITDRLLSMATDSLISGLFKGFLGGGAGAALGAPSGGFDLLGSIGKAFGFAEGGLVQGPGGPREDRVTARLSAGEYVINANATVRHFDLIEAINAGRLPGFARGGLFSSPTPEVGEERACEVTIAA